MINIKNINKKPIDPLTENEYTYSITSWKTEYQIWAISEWWQLWYKLPINQTHAAVIKNTTAMIRWTYNEKFLRVQNWSISRILSMPSIIVTDITQTDIQTILNTKNLVHNNYQNVPHSYNNMWYIMTGWFNYTNTNPLIYSGSLKSLTESNTGKLDFITKLKVAYNGTILQWEPNYQDIVAIDPTTNSTWAVYLVNRFINTNVWWIKVSNIILPTSWTIEYTEPVVQWKDIPWTNCTNDDYVFTLAWTTYRWAWCNSALWTTGISTNADVYNWNCYNYAWWTTTTNCNSTYLTFTAKENAYNSTHWEDNIWWKLYLLANAVQTNNACPTWWHLPTDLEWEKLETYLNWWTNCRNSTDWWLCDWLGWAWKSSKTDQNNIIKALKLPLAGFRNGGTFNNRGNRTYLWSSTEFDSTFARSRRLDRGDSYVYRDFRKKSAYGFSVRCIKD